MSTLLDWELADAVAWADTTFPAATQESRMAHLRREVAELVAAHEAGGAGTIREEVADVLLLLAHYAAHAEIDLGCAVRDKLRVNRARTWGRPDADGVVEHEREGGLAP